MRRGELLGLRWSDVDMDKAQLQVAANGGDRWARSPVFRAKMAAGRRAISLDPATIAARRCHRAAQAEERLAWGPAWTDGLCSPVRTETRSTPSGSPSCSTKPGTTPARRTLNYRSSLSTGSGTRTPRLSCAPPACQSESCPQRLGHASVNVTLGTYGHVLPGDDEAAAVTAASPLCSTGPSR